MLGPPSCYLQTHSEEGNNKVLEGIVHDGLDFLMKFLHRRSLILQGEGGGRGGYVVEEGVRGIKERGGEGRNRED